MVGIWLIWALKIYIKTKTSMPSFNKTPKEKDLMSVVKSGISKKYFFIIPILLSLLINDYVLDLPKVISRASLKFPQDIIAILIGQLIVPVVISVIIYSISIAKHKKQDKWRFLFIFSIVSLLFSIIVLVGNWIWQRA